MRKTMLALLFVVGLISCNSTPEGFTIKGDLRGDLQDSTKIFLKRIGDMNQPVDVDTTYLVNGKFEFTGNAAGPELHYLFVDNSRNFAAIILENGPIAFSAQIDSMGFAEFGGTLQNDIFSDYLETSRELTAQARNIQMDLQQAQMSTDPNKDATMTSLQDEMKELQEEYQGFEAKFIADHPNGLISAMLLERAVATQNMKASEIEEMFQALTPEIQNSVQGKKVSEGLEKLKQAEIAGKNTAIGAKAPNFSGPNPDGDIVALNDVLGKATLIDFWAAWCRPCRAENPNIVSVYNKYHDKGFNVIGVSLDRTAEAWKKAIEDDGLVWHQISNIAYFDDEIARLYNVNAIPAAFLLDENGVIVAKNLRGADLEREVAKLLD
ncbi:redoxin domain-containing protein [Maribacter sp. 2307ULW6-5]|uniref:redoxin domain-containing protein n=1 Tax=Maribacter sp. 2307ULW6-5 TaxID=3386275 RepID=UPI0039BCA5EE